MPGGYVGVDVFFVVSGFLITSHLVKEAERSGRIVLRQFWARRIRRLLPAATTTVVLSLIAVAIWVPRSYWPDFTWHGIASSLYFENWALAAQAVDYLAAENAATPFQHYWSLSVEEQFYLIWPLIVLMIALRVRSSQLRRGLLIAIGILGAASFLYGLYATVATPSVAYFSSFTRAWQFAAGALLALALGNRTLPRFAGAASILGFLVVIASSFVYNATTAFPGYAALLPVVGAILVMAAGMPAWAPLRALYATRPVQWLGDVSYSAYLIHWPVIVILPFVTGHDVTWLETLVLLAATLVGAGLMKRGVEDRLRVAGHLPRTWPTFVVTLLAMALITAGALGMRAAATAPGESTEDVLQTASPEQISCVGFPAVDPETADACEGVLLGDVIPDRLAVADDVPVVYDTECRTSPTSEEFKKCVFGDETSSTVAVLVGDSHAAQWFPALETIAEDNGWRLEVYFKAACSFSDAVDSLERDDTRESCSDWNAWVMDQLQEERPQYIFTSAVAGHEFVNAAGEIDNDIAIAGYAERWRQLQDLGSQVTVMVDTPQMSNETQACVAASTGPAPDCVEDRSYALERADNLTPAAEEVGDITLIDINDMLCTETECPAVIGSVVAYRDTSSHMTQTFGETLAPYFARQLGLTE